MEIPFLFLVGTLLAIQAAANVQLSSATGSPFGASTLQLGIGALLLLVATAVAGSLGAFGGLEDAEAWHLIGGLGSAIYITSGILLFPRLGAVLTVGLWIAGQMLGSLVLDGFGWLGVEREPIAAADVVGALAVLAGAALIVKAQTAQTGKPRWIALGLLAGAALPIQGAINAQLRADLDAVVAVGALSFVVATAAMGLLLLVSGATRPRVPRAMPWWGWLGGLFGAIYVTSVFSLIPEIGAAATIALTVGGQQAASVLVDRYGLLRLPQRRVSALRLGAVGLPADGRGADSDRVVARERFPAAGAVGRLHAAHELLAAQRSRRRERPARRDRLGAGRQLGAQLAAVLRRRPAVGDPRAGAAELRTRALQRAPAGHAHRALRERRDRDVGVGDERAVLRDAHPHPGRSCVPHRPPLTSLPQLSTPSWT